MSQQLQIAFEIAIALFQSILYLRFACSCLSIRSKWRGKTGVFCLVGAALTALLAGLKHFAVFQGAELLVGSLYLLVFSAVFLEGGTVRKCIVSPLLPMAAEIAGMISAAFWGIVLSGEQSVFLEALLAGCILFAIYRNARAAFLKEKEAVSEAERPVMYAQLLCSMVLLLLIFFLAGRGSPIARLILSIAAAGMVIWDFVLFHLLCRLHRQHRAELEGKLVQQEKSTQLRVDELNYQYEQLQKVRHDFHNTLHVIKSLNAERKPDRIDAYIDAYFNASHTSATFIASENEYANAIINAKAGQAREEGIEVKVVVTSGIAADNPVDICNVLGNMFDNAIAACRKITGSKRISLNIYDNGDETAFCMKNSIAHSVLEFNPDLRSDKADKQNHGYGTGIIREIAAKYKGFADFYEESGEFCCNVVMYLK